MSPHSVKFPSLPGMTYPRPCCSSRHSPHPAYLAHFLCDLIHVYEGIKGDSPGTYTVAVPGEVLQSCSLNEDVLPASVAKEATAQGVLSLTPG